MCVRMCIYIYMYIYVCVCVMYRLICADARQKHLQIGLPLSPFAEQGLGTGRVSWLGCNGLHLAGRTLANRHSSVNLKIESRRESDSIRTSGPSVSFCWAS